MSYTRAQLVTLTEEAMDAVGSDRWGSTLKLQALSTVFGRGWRRILGANRTYRWARRSVTLDSDGRCTVASLDSGSGDSAERFHKLLAAAKVDTQQRYRVGEFMDDPLRTLVHPTFPSFEVWRQGDNLQFTPVEAVSVYCFVNHTPTLPKDLATDSSTIVWPADEYVPILAYEAGAFLLGKGGAEAGAAQTLSAMAEDLWKDLLSDVARFSTDPLFVQASDHPSEWGG
jgi:hypothetical protein